MVHKRVKVRGIPLVAIKKMVKTRRTPAHLRAFWVEQLQKAGASGR